MTDLKSYILWYHSESHKKDRYFVGITKRFCGTGCPGHPFPAWDYNKNSATIIDGTAVAQQTQKFAEVCGYKNLKLEPIDESASKKVFGVEYSVH